jgi:4'-phosphopantetheinyl transferase EntD
MFVSRPARPGEKAAARFGEGRRMTVLVEVFGDVTVDSDAAEARVVRHAVPERRREHATVRACARAGLVQLGQRPAPILNDADGVPLWPVGVVGSLTHCRGYRAALVARRIDLNCVGIDAEPHLPLPTDVADVVLHRDDTNDLCAGWHAGRIAFCAKEAAYKTWFPGHRQWLEFTDMTTHVRTDGTFTAWASGLPMLHGRWMVRGGYVVAAGMLPC